MAVEHINLYIYILEFKGFLSCSTIMFASILFDFDFFVRFSFALNEFAAACATALALLVIPDWIPLLIAPGLLLGIGFSGSFVSLGG